MDLRWTGRGSAYYFDIDKRIKKTTGGLGTVDWFAGSGKKGTSGPAPTDAASVNFSPLSPTLTGSLMVDRSGNVILGDTGNHVIRSITPDGRVTTLAGTGLGTANSFAATATGASSVVALPSVLTMGADGTLYFVSDYSVVRALSPQGEVRLIGGNATRATSGDGGPAKQATFDVIQAIAVDSRNRIYVATNNSTSVGIPVGSQIRMIDEKGNVSRFAGSATTLGSAGDGGAPANSQFNGIYGLAVDGQANLYVSDTNNYRIRRIGVSGAARLQLISGGGQGLEAGAVDQIVVQAVDAKGVGVAGANLSFRGEGIVVSSAPAKTDSQGQATVSITAGATPGPGALVISSPGVADLRVDLRILGPLAITSIVNAYDGSSTFAAGTLLRIQLDQVRGAVGDVSLTANGEPLLASGIDGSVSVAALPYDLSAGSFVIAAMETGRGPGQFNLDVALVAPALLGSGGVLTATNEDGSVNSPSLPAAPGSAITVMVTGFGGVDGNGVPIGTPNATIDGESAAVESFTVVAPGEAKVVVRLPADLSADPMQRLLTFTLNGAPAAGMFSAGSQ